MNKYLLIGIGGFLGSVARYAVGVWVGERVDGRFPYGTFLINISGSFLIGLIMVVLESRTNLSPNWRYLVPIGFIGAYTTFSTFSLETFRLGEDRELLTAGLYVVLSVVLGLLSVWWGMAAGRALCGQRTAWKTASAGVVRTAQNHAPVRVLVPAGQESVAEPEGD